MLIGQQTIDVDAIRLDDVIKSLEMNSEFIFNYDPRTIRLYNFSGQLDLTDVQKCISQVLYDTPFEYSINESTVLIFEPEPTLLRICGTLIDSQTNEILIGGNVYANNTSQGTLSDEQGYFEFSIKGQKNQKISFSYIGYETLELSVRAMNQVDCESIAMVSDEQLFKEGIVITDYILDGITEEINYNGFAMDYGRLSKQHSMIEHDVLKTAQFLPGITSVDESATNLQIRGGTPDQNLIMWEGVPIYQPGHIFGMISAINPFSIRKVDIHQGVHNPKYDNRVGGIVDISVTDSIENSGHGSVGTTLTEAHFNVEMPILSNKLQVFLSGRRSINEIYYSTPLENYTTKVFQFSKIDDHSTGFEEGVNDVTQELKFHDISTKVLYKPTESISLNVAYYENSQAFQYKLSFLDDPFNTTDNINANNEAFKAEVAWKPNKKWSSSLSLINSKYESEYTYVEEELGFTGADNRQFNDIRDQSITLSTNYEVPFLKLNAGYDYNTKGVNYNIKNDSPNQPLYEDNSFEEGEFHNFFASTSYNYKKLHLSSGVRSTYYMERNRWYHSPRLSLQYQLNDKFKLKTEAGLFHQFISQLQEYDGNGIQVQSPLWALNAAGPNSTQTAKKISAGMNYRNQGWLIDLEAFYNETDGLTTLAPVFKLIPTLEFSDGKSDAKGLAIIAKKRWRNFDTWINYSLSEIKYTFPELFQPTFAAPNEIRHNLNFVSSYTYKSLQFSLIGNYRSGLPYSTPAGVLEINDPDENENYYILEYTTINKERLEHYARVDFSINYRPKFNLLGSSKMEVSLSFLNLLNRENVYDRGFYVDLESEIIPPEIAIAQKTLLERTPLLLFRVYW